MQDLGQIGALLQHVYQPVAIAVMPWQHGAVTCLFKILHLLQSIFSLIHPSVCPFIQSTGTCLLNSQACPVLSSSLIEVLSGQSACQQTKHITWYIPVTVSMTCSLRASVLAWPDVSS